MLNDPVLIEDLIEDLEGAAPVDHVVLRDDLKPIDHRLPGENVIVMRNSKADADAIVGVPVKTIGGHVYSDCG
jgi:hypothetical protein